MPNDADLAAAAFIAELWSKRAREFGRRYWQHLTCKAPRPEPACFDSERITKRLERILREYKHLQ